LIDGIYSSLFTINGSITRKQKSESNILTKSATLVYLLRHEDAVLYIDVKRFYAFLFTARFCVLIVLFLQLFFYF